jgi:hypothetical protein
MLEIARANHSIDTPPNIGATPSPGSAPQRWSLPRRIGFRFIFAWCAVWLVPWPLGGTLPGTAWIGAPFDRAWDALVIWLGNKILHRAVDVAGNGSGDRTADWIMLAVITVAALIATAVWSVLDRRRADYARLNDWFRVYLRFAVGTMMLGYGFAKIFHSQFPFPAPIKLEQPYGDASPMGLLWTFMGFSAPYNVFTGLAELVPAVLLFFRRTATLGALLLVAVMTNVVMLNFCYDVPVKIFSTELLLASLLIAAPRLRALFDVLVRGRAVTALPPERRFVRPRLELAARIFGVAFALWVIGNGAWGFVQRARSRPNPTVSEGVIGTWEVDEFIRDGQVVAPTLAEAARWRTVTLAVYKGSGRFLYRQVDDTYDRLELQQDEAKKALSLTPIAGPKRTLHYTQPDKDHLTLTGDFDGHALAVKLHRRTATRSFRLLDRGFHWVNEAPYNR